MLLGLSFSHNATVCVVSPESGTIRFCCAEERFSRRKNEWGIPRRALAHVFAHVAPPEAFSGVVIGEACELRYGSQAFARLINLSDYATKDRAIQSKGRIARIVLEECLGRLMGREHALGDLVIRELGALGLDAAPVFVNHHESHAASAYYTAPFDEALVITLDGEGDGLCGSCWHGVGAQLTQLDTLPDIASPGLFYKSITSLLGFKVNQQEGKVTGLAAYGDPDRFYVPLRAMLQTQCNAEGIAITSRAAEEHLGRLSRKGVNFHRLLAAAPALLRARRWETLLNDVLRAQFRAMYAQVLPCDVWNLGARDRADLAAAAQRVLEESVLTLAQHYMTRVPCRNLALAGGVFANVKLNQRLLEETDAEAVYICPAMGDEGLALGAALRQCHTGRDTKHAASRLRHVFLGPAATAHEAEDVLIEAGKSTATMEDDALAHRVAEVLAEDGIVGIFRGAAEFGPRALGHRSILAHPAGFKVTARLNAALQRSEFMPFAPVVLPAHFPALFEGSHLSGAWHACRYMTMALPVRQVWRERIPEVVHVDGTARPQICLGDDDPFLDAVLHHFYTLTGLPCLLNTSFNLHEEPIVCTAADALRAAQEASLDVLVMGARFVYLRARDAQAQATDAPAIVSQAR